MYVLPDQERGLYRRDSALILDFCAAQFRSIFFGLPFFCFVAAVFPFERPDFRGSRARLQPEGLRELRYCRPYAIIVFSFLIIRGRYIVIFIRGCTFLVAVAASVSMFSAGGGCPLTTDIKFAVFTQIAVSYGSRFPCCIMLCGVMILLSIISGFSPSV